MLSPEDQHRVLVLAREALVARVCATAPPPARGGGVLDYLSGAFVTIHCNGELRGCLGRIEADRPLADVIAHLARAVADSDPRFSPVTPLELDDLTLEVSVLTPEREVRLPDDIEVGRHGLIIEQRGRRGLLLPQVAVEHGWDRTQFLEHTCLKAGLHRDAWRGARILVFEAQVFSEPAMDQS